MLHYLQVLYTYSIVNHTDIMRLWDCMMAEHIDLDNHCVKFSRLRVVLSLVHLVFVLFLSLFRVTEFQCCDPILSGFVFCDNGACLEITTQHVSRKTNSVGSSARLMERLCSVQRCMCPTHLEFCVRAQSVGYLRRHRIMSGSVDCVIVN